LVGSGSEITNALLPQLPRDSQQDRTYNAPHEANNLKTTEAAHQDPDEAQAGRVTRDQRPYDLVAAEQDGTAQPE
jgi:hypothetical protein